MMFATKVLGCLECWWTRKWETQVQIPSELQLMEYLACSVHHVASLQHVIN